MTEYDPSGDNAEQDERQSKIDQLINDYDYSEEDGTISFNRACETELDLLGQYAVAFIDGFEGKPKLAEGLVTGNPAFWLELRITPENFLVFTDRITAYKKEQIELRLARLSNR